MLFLETCSLFMEGTTKAQKTATFRDLPFCRLIERDQRLAEVRRENLTRTAEERHRAADWAYHASCANTLFNRVLALGGQEPPIPEEWPEGIAALAIDPTYAPALLTVGSMEYQLGRKEAADALFHELLQLSADTEDVEVIIDKAGAFLLDQKDFQRATEFYAAACAIFPGSPALLGGLGYGLAKLKRLAESVFVQRRALALDPSNHQLLNDLGWALTEIGDFQEAEEILQKAIGLSPPDYHLAKDNLEEARRRKRAPNRHAPRRSKTC